MKALISISQDYNYKGGDKVANIKDYLNGIKSAVYGKEVRGAIHDAIKQVYDDASVNHDNANMEVKMARGTHNTLNDRLDNVDEIQTQTNAQLSNVKLNKVDKLEPKKQFNLTRVYRSIDNNGNNVASYLQGATKTIGNKVVYSIYDVTTPSSNIVDLIEVDLKTGIELRRNTLRIGHCNSMTFNHTTNELIIANLKKYVADVETYVSELIIVDYDSLTIKNIVELGNDYVVSGVAYDNLNDKYMVLIDDYRVARCNATTFAIEEIIDLDVPEKIKTFIRQSLEVWNNQIYLCGYKHNYISVYNFDGTNVQNYYVPDYIDEMYMTGELEDISALGNGLFLLFSAQNVGNISVINMISEFSITNDVISGAPYDFNNAGGPKKIYVDVNSQSPNPTGTIDNPFRELHEAILSCHNPVFSNIEIILGSGTYEWAYVGDVNATIRIVGNSKDNTFIKGVFVNGCKVTLAKVGFKESSNPTYKGLISVFNGELVIDDVNVDSTTTHGIYANAGSVVSIKSLNDTNVSDMTYTVYGINGSDIRFQKTASNIVKIYVDNSTRLYPHVMLYNNTSKTELSDIVIPRWATKLITDNSLKFMDIVCGVRATDNDDVLLQTYRIQTSNYADFSINLNRALQNYTIISSAKITGNNSGEVITLRHDNNYFTRIESIGTIETSKMTANKIGSILIYRIFLTN